ncbi:hypothetical protein BGW36DRAFT_432609 [Talaromyces proteolyticus]|uniref:Xylanolytic transcriptional activator regulatory domain-containing protein n=1 Tax=Talaromyces proteolyticus TaxID=1131652 RepID=A0AAD4KLH1_9EURO|nr:uncharacterized protein BGW36DRAFT_432609 [Talaromyces proteolyticus]KAH8690826.1 hypothetical protein BGW36DRAFT_432609 [Talaromyces proteolyticus]
MVKFINTNIDRIRKKRKDTVRACEKCRTRKKRCSHRTQSATIHEQTPARSDTRTENVLNSITTSLLMPNGTGNIAGQKQDEQNVPQSGTFTVEILTDLQETEANKTSIQPLESRFIGYLNPEGIVRGTDLECPRDGVSSAGKVGVWHSERHDESRRKITGFRMPSPSSLFDDFPAVSQKTIVSILKEECLSCLPIPECREALRNIYFQKIHPIFPVINKDVFRRLAPGSPASILLEQGICLAASTDSNSTPYLVMTPNSTPLSLKQFGSRIFSAMRITIEIGLVVDNLILIQALTLMSLFANGRKSSQTSSLMLGQAVQYIHSLGLHMQERDGEPDRDYAETLFCCVWTIDRLNAALHGRPVLMHERDVGRSLQKCFDTQSPPFRLLLSVVGLLDRVIKLYYPLRAEMELVGDFPLFEDLINACNACQVSKGLLTTIEILYYAIAILSHRTKPGESNSTPGSFASRTRQIHAAERITAIVSHEPHEQLSLFPFIPYAVSLSLSVAYREMRRSKVPMYRSRAQNAMEANCHLLGSLGQIFWSAEAMAEFGNMTLKELSRVYSNITDTEVRNSQREVFETWSTTDSIQDIHLASRLSNPDAYEQNLASLPNEHNPFDFTEVPNLDPFQMFDPRFNLDSVDAYLDGYLDLGFQVHRG